MAIAPLTVTVSRQSQDDEGWIEKQWRARFLPVYEFYYATGAWEPLLAEEVGSHLLAVLRAKGEYVSNVDS